MWCLVTLLVGIAVPADVYCIIRTINTVWPEYRIYYPIFNNTIGFDVRAGHDAWIAFTNSTDPISSKYEVVLGAYENTMVVIVQDRVKTIARKEIAVLNENEYRGFWIKIKNKNNSTVCDTQFKLSVGRHGETASFLESVQPCFLIKYFALATTGAAGISGHWIIHDLDENTGILGKLNYAHFETTCTENLDYRDQYFKFSSNIRLQFKTNSSNEHWILLTPDKVLYPNYEFKYSGSTIELLKNSVVVDSAYYYVGQIIDGEMFHDFWIDFNVKSPHQAIICIGKGEDQTSLIRYIDNNANYGVKYISVATVCFAELNNKTTKWYIPQY